MVTVEATHSKHRRDDRVPLHPDLVLRLRERLATLATGERLWPGTWAKYTAAFKLIKHDLAAARRVWLSEAVSDEERATYEASDFLVYEDREG